MVPELVSAVPGSPEWLAARGERPLPEEWVHETARGLEAYRRPPLKLTPYSRTGMIHGAFDAARPARLRRGYCVTGAGSWMYRRGFARAFLAARRG